MKSIFIGTRIESFSIFKKYNSVQKVITTKNSYIDRYINKRKYKVIYVNSKNKFEIFKYIYNSENNLILSCGFPFVIPSQYLNKKKKIINSHPSLLPKYKGYSPIKMAILNKEVEIGVTVHYLSQKLDEGKIIAVKKINIEKYTDSKIIYKKIFSIIEPQTILMALKKI